MSALATRIPLSRPKVAIVGFTSHNEKAPWADDSWAIWSLNDLHSWVDSFAPDLWKTNRVEWFQMHRPESGHFHGARDPKHFEWMTKQTFPIWMWETHPEIPASRPLPAREMIAAALPYAYLNNSISIMILFALMRGAKEIGLWGVDMAVDGLPGEGEHAFQRPSVEYWLGVAQGMGVTVHLPIETELLWCGYIYGLDNAQKTRRKGLTRIEQLAAMEQQIVGMYEHAKHNVHHAEGRIAQLTELQAVEATKPAAEERLPKIRQEHQDWLNELEAQKRSLHEVRGSIKELQMWLRHAFPGDGPIQDFKRSERSITMEDLTPALPPIEIEELPNEPQASDGRRRKRANRLVGVEE